MRAGRRTWAASALLVGLGLAAVAVAGASVRKDGGVVNDKTQTFTAKCPQGERLDVGGFRSIVNGPSGIIVEDLTFNPQRTWKARFDGLGDAARASAIAYCGHTPALTKRTASETLPPLRAAPGRRGGGTPITATATCPAGTTVQLGGFAVVDSLVGPPRGGPPSQFRPSSMTAPSARKWRVSGSGQPGMKLTAVAGCADAPAPDPVTKKVTVAGGGSKTSARAECPAGTHVVMGGFRQTPYQLGGAYLRGLERPARRTWKTTVWQFGSESSLTAIAYCG